MSLVFTMESRDIKRPPSNCHWAVKGLLSTSLLRWTWGGAVCGLVGGALLVTFGGAFLCPRWRLSWTLCLTWRPMSPSPPPWPQAFLAVPRPSPRLQSPFQAGLMPGSALNLFSSMLFHYVSILCSDFYSHSWVDDNRISWPVF